MEPADRRRLEELVDQCGFTESYERFSPEARDAFVYSIELESEKGSVKISFDEMSVSPSCGPLLEFLQERSAWRPPE
jgi:hypothetical protein